METIQIHSRLAQCSICRNDMSNCPHYEQNATSPCEHYQDPIDNSKFFGHFFSIKGRIGRLEYLLTTIIGVALAFLGALHIGTWYTLITGDVNYDMTTATIIGCIALLTCAALLVVAGIKRCHDSGTSIWYAYIPAVSLFVLNGILGFFCIVAIFFLFFQKGDEGINAYGTEPGKDYNQQISEALEQFQNN